ncbi:MAG: Rieske 2Fe-2S domain-containing protein [Burkholderiales bacterium]|nr:Rieske 2Fe-2S domain-containing protein [Burkholderiales bacterium]
MARRQRLIAASDEIVERGRGLRFSVDAAEGDWLPAFAIRYKGVVYAYINRCAHLSVELDWAQGNFFDVSGLYLVCATHGAAYFPNNGKCAMGPCKGGALQPLPITERDGNVYLIEQEDAFDE